MILFRFLYQPVFFIVFAALFAFSGAMVKDGRKHLGARYALNIINVPPYVIRFLAGEFNGLVADFTLLQIASFAGSGKADISSDEWRNVVLGYDQIMELDPYFEQSYLQAQSFVAWDAGMPEEAIRLLDISRKSRTWDFRPGFYMGFDYYFFFADYENASEIFLETAKMKNAPVLLALLGSRFASRQGRTEASIFILENMLEEPDITESKTQELKKRIAALQGVLVIEKAVKRYSEVYGSNPESLDKLVEAGVLEKLPGNPYLASYIYDSKNNEVRFDSVGPVQK